MERTYAQNERQTHRGRDGKYEDMARCEMCGKRLGSDYCSDLRVDTHFGGLGLTLCDEHGSSLDRMSDETALDVLRAAERYRSGGKYLLVQPGKKRRTKPDNPS